MEENPGLVSAQTVVEEWEAAPGTTELQEIPGLEGVKLRNFMIMGIMEAGEYLAILEVHSFSVTLRSTAKLRVGKSTWRTLRAILYGWIMLGIRSLRLQLEGGRFDGKHQQFEMLLLLQMVVVRLPLTHDTQQVPYISYPGRDVYLSFPPCRTRSKSTSP